MSLYRLSSNCIVDLQTGDVLKDGGKRKITVRKARQLLELLIHAKIEGRCLETPDIRYKLWGHSIDESTFTKTLGHLRKQIGEDLILTERSVGYYLKFRPEKLDASHDDIFAEKNYSHEPPTPPLTPPKNSNIVFRSYYDLLESGKSAEDIAQNLYENDKKLYEGFEEHFPDSYDSWSSVMRGNPDGWGFLCDQDNNIVSNFSFIFINEEQEAKLRSGKYLERDFSNVNEHIPMNTGSQGEYVAIHVLNLSVNDGYQNYFEFLLQCFGKRLFDLTQKGIFYHRLYGTVLRADHHAIMKSLGFKEVAECKHNGKNYGSVYSIDLFYEMPKSFKKIFPTDISDMDIHCVPLSSIDDIATVLPDVVNLLWSTDRYIYPAIMDLRQAHRVLPKIIMSGEDRMFNVDNTFVAINNSNRVIGVILYTENLYWTSDVVCKYLNVFGENPSKHLNDVEKNYFSRYSDLPDDTIAVLNFAVNPLVLNFSVGRKLMTEFIAHHSNSNLFLHVLEETDSVFNTYMDCGFRIETRINGYSPEGKNLPCFTMMRKVKRLGLSK